MGVNGTHNLVVIDIDSWASEFLFLNANWAIIQLHLMARTSYISLRFSISQHQGLSTCIQGCEVAWLVPLVGKTCQTGWPKNLPPITLLCVDFKIKSACTDFLKFVFILLDIGPAPRNFLLDPLNFCRTYIFYVKLF